ncbi:MAG: hypothetical protein IJ225_11860 [Solobacterium sp.]|nr:hypothetical protein [Solobacterium sp.]
MKRAVESIIVLLLTLGLIGCTKFNGSSKAADDEIKLLIHLDLKEDIGLLILDINVNGVETTGGISTVDRTMLKQDELLYWSLYKREYENPEGMANVSIRFRIITEYCDPNYENEYPEELTVLLEPLLLSMDFGTDCHITITGDHRNGYMAILDQP